MTPSMAANTTQIEMQVIDSHTEGEPTRLVVAGGPPLGHGPLSERKALFARDFDHYRVLAANEPRGYDAVVGALLCEPVDSSCAAGLIFFFIGVIEALARKRHAVANPWGPGATTLEWTLPSPVPFHTFETLPRIDAQSAHHA